MSRIQTSLDKAASDLLSMMPGDLKIAAPLGLGKANQLLNLIYDRFKADPGRHLEIYTALSLDIPAPNTLTEKRLLTPFFERHFGKDYPKLRYVQDLKNKAVPSNIRLHEFYFLAGQYSQVPAAQQNYISLNYTHAARAIAGRGLQVVIQMISKRTIGGKALYSLSCNPDVTLDLKDLYREEGKKLVIVGVVHPELPFLGGDAVIEEDFFDMIVDSPEVNHRLFALPKNSVDAVDALIGFHGSRLMPDDGTLQIGIGSLSDSLVSSLLLRHRQNDEYRRLAGKFGAAIRGAGEHLGFFEKGIYGTSEMLMDGFMHLRKAGILKREIFDQDERKKRFLHAAFFLGTRDLYAWLGGLTGADFEGLSMTRVSKVNDLYDAHELALRRQRKNARFYNTCMQVNLLGGVSSDTLPDGQVVSGVGGQYNFVAMSQELPDAHSVLMLRSTRTKNGRRLSNIVTSSGQLTIPRHLRDVVITEYGIACLKGRSDAEVAAALIEISDAEFQDELIAQAQKSRKLPADYRVPDHARGNTFKKVEEFMKSEGGFFPESPFGSDFTEVERKIIRALAPIKENPKSFALKLLISGIFRSSSAYAEELGRLQLLRPATLEERISRWVVTGALHRLNRR